MSIPVVAFFNNKGGVGKTSMVYHLAWMFSDSGLRVMAADLDPQSNLTASFLDEDRLEQVMPGNGPSLTIFGAIQPLKQGTGDIANPHVEIITDRLGLILGDMALSTFEDDLSEVWPKCLGGDPPSLSYHVCILATRTEGGAGTRCEHHSYRSRTEFGRNQPCVPYRLGFRSNPTGP